MQEHRFSKVAAGAGVEFSRAQDCERPMPAAPSDTGKPDFEQKDASAADQASIESRAAPRFTLMIRPAQIRVGDLQSLCVIRDVSATGISLRLFHPVEWNGPITLGLQTGSTFEIEHVWSKGLEAGFRFKAPVDVAELVHQTGPYPRRDLRIDLDLPVKLHNRELRCSGQLENLSRQGARILCDRPLPIDQQVMLEIPGLPTLDARVRWRRDRAHGLVFDTTFSLSDFALLAFQLQRGPTRQPPPASPAMPAHSQAILHSARD